MAPLHSNADALSDGRLTAPAATRNSAAIVQALAPLLPARGRVLEIAAGTGQHAVALAQAFPGLDWRATDIAPERLASVDAWRAEEGVDNMRVAARLDATAPDWQAGPFDVVYLANLFHLISREAAQNVIRGAARALVPGGAFYAYGPFRTAGAFRSEGDRAFDARLRAADARTGYKAAEWIAAEARAAGLAPCAMIEMPANNLILGFARA